MADGKTLFAGIVYNKQGQGHTMRVTMDVIAMTGIHAYYSMIDKNQ